jgi:L-iditol 2-dehydrogenase
LSIHPSLVTGAGPIGVCQLLCAAAAGASPIVITDLAQERLDFAKKLCPEVHPFKIDLNLTPEESARQIVKVFTAATHGVGGEMMPSKVLECTGVESSIAVASYACKPSGLVFVLGVGKSHLTIPFMHLSTNEIDLKFLFRYVSCCYDLQSESKCRQAADTLSLSISQRDTWPKAIRLVASGKIPSLKQIVTHTFPLEKAKEAVEHSADRSVFSVKTLIVDEED